VPFETRALLFKYIIGVERANYENQMFDLLQNEGMEIRREYILEDAFQKMFPLQQDIKKKIRVRPPSNMCD